MISVMIAERIKKVLHLSCLSTVFIVIIQALCVQAQPMETQLENQSPMKNYQTATFAGGCFWCLQPPFDDTAGVLRTVVGYAGGKEENPTYEQVSSHQTSHVEAIQITYDPDQVNFETLLQVFWHNIDPFDASGQFCDKGAQYKAVIFAHNQEQLKVAQTSKQTIQHQFENINIVTEIRPFTNFYPAEDYHQNYYQKNPLRYKFYRYNCGRDKRLKEVWSKQDEGRH